VEPIEHSALPLVGPLCCDVIAHKVTTFSTDMFSTLRRRPGPGLGESLPANFLKHADEQAVAGLAAVLSAIADFQLTPAQFRQWGIIAAPCFLGRATLATALGQFASEGPWGLSPHFIPHRSQHAVSGTISLALKIHGPNFGSGGGSTGVVESLLAGMVLLSDDSLPGLWVVVTGWHPESIPTKTSAAPLHGSCLAMALALTAHQPGASRPKLTVTVSQHANGSGKSGLEPALVDFAAVLSKLASGEGTDGNVHWRCHGGVTIELSGRHPGTPLPRPHYLQRLSGDRAASLRLRSDTGSQR
jgi:hypothetical protein